MPEPTRSQSQPSTVVWENLEETLRQKIQSWLQDLLDEEVTAFLGRIKSQRRAPDAPVGTPPTGYRNGHGKPRCVTTAVGTITVRRPRVRGVAERLESRVLPLFARCTAAVGELLPQLSLHGLAAGDFDQALRGLLGEEAPLSASSLLRRKAKWQQEYDAWNRRSLAEEQVVYLWVDGIYVKTGLEKEKAALLVAVGALADGSQVILAVQAGHRESTESGSSLLRDLKRRGMNGPRLVIGDGHLGIWGALANVSPEAGEQRCGNHRILHGLDRVPKGKQAPVSVWLREIMDAPTREKAVEKKERFQRWCQEQQLGEAGRLLEEDWERLVAYYAYPKDPWMV